MGKDRGPILVVGATGRQGGAVARHLVLNGWEVRAMTRDKTKAIAKGLKDLGAAETLPRMVSLELAAGGLR